MARRASQRAWWLLFGVLACAAATVWILALGRRPQATSSGLDHPLVSIPAGSFSMGSPTDEPGRNDDELQHPVSIRRSFALGATEVTQELYAQVTGSNPSRHPGDPRRPVEGVTWLDAVRLCNDLSRLEGLQPAYELTGESAGEVRWDQGADGYRLPTEAEWEYAARAGAHLRLAGEGDAGDLAWYADNTRGRPEPVGRKSPNAWGLHDMSGNVREWVWDRYGPYPPGRQDDPSGPEDGGDRVTRGGSFDGGEADLRPAVRREESPQLADEHIGLRLARTLPEGP